MSAFVRKADYFLVDLEVVTFVVTIDVRGAAFAAAAEALVKVATIDNAGVATAVRDTVAGDLTVNALYFRNVVYSDAAPFKSGIY